MKTTDFKKRAEEFFKSEPEATRVYFTSDGNAFRAEHYARNWATSLTDREISPFYKDGHEPTETESQPAIGDTEANGAGSSEETETVDAVQGEEREILIKAFIEKFDTKPIDGLSNDALKRAIESGVEPVAGDEPASPPVADEPVSPIEPVVELTELQKLQARYFDLFGVKPNHRTGEAKLKAQIAEKEAEKK